MEESFMMELELESNSEIVLSCTFEDFDSYWGKRYTGVVENLKTSLKNREVTKVVGDHLPGKSNDDVKQIFIKGQDCPYLPIGLGKFFVNLEILYVIDSNVKHLTSCDLNGLDKLRIFDVSHNPIKRLKGDYFQGHPTIEIVSFFECSLSFIEKGALDPLVNLKEGHFQFNACIDYRADHQSKIERLKMKIDECADPIFKFCDIDEELRQDIRCLTKRIEALEVLLRVKEPISFVQRHSTAIAIAVSTAFLALVIILFKVDSFSSQKKC